MGGGRKEKSSSSSSSSSDSLGRALIRQRNRAVVDAKERGISLREQQRAAARRALPLESVIEVSDIDALLQRGDEEILISFDEREGTPKDREKMQKEEEALHAGSLKVPRRPPWNSQMSVEELDANERRAFLEWRRSLARLEENENLVLTPFEKNLDVWRQLWRVVERSDLLVMVVDGRDPLFYRCPDLEVYAREVDVHKETLLLVNKADLLPLNIRRKWAEYFRSQGILFVFWSAKVASAALEGKLSSRSSLEDAPAESDEDTKVYGRDELLERLQAEAEAIVAQRQGISDSEDHKENSSDAGSAATKHVVVGFVGYPNVGKSSTINALVGAKRTGVTSTPGKTKHFQTLIISDELMLCDCPGLVFPSFSSSRHHMVASGVLPIDKMTQHRDAVQVVANRVPRHVLERVYNITLPKPKPYEPQNRPPTSSELLRAFCTSRRHVTSAGLPDETRAARQILKDYVDGRILHFELPPDSAEDASVAHDDELDYAESFSGNESDLEDLEDSDELPDELPNGESTASAPPSGLDISDVLQDLKSFELENGGKSAALSKRRPKEPSHKNHKKPQRKKDRSWRVQTNDSDGMPVIRVFQKPTVKKPAF